MERMKRMSALLIAVAALTVACSSGEPAPTQSAQVIGPIILNASETSAVVTVDRTVVFDVAEPALWSISASPEGLVDVSVGGESGGAIFNPGATALAVGVATVTLTHEGSGEVLIFTITIE
jgi:uncharacterized protein YcfL